MIAINMFDNPDEFIPTRKSLLSRLKNLDDQDSWADFFNTYWKLIYGVARRAGLADADAQEVVQQTVIEFANKMQEFKYDATKSFKAFLLTMTRWRIIDQLRKHQRAEARAPLPSDTTHGASAMEAIPDPAGPELEDIWDEEWEKNIWDAAIEKVKQQVNAKQYQIFDLYVMKEWPVQKVAHTLGISIARVYLAKHRIGRLIQKEVRILREKES
ncbi:MAG TPA: sigma-70 family RNA polymerase sigma factor [Candidatus Nitrosotalea sp.]|nr:sigma-70 family RNA polymerase sigma factor [Candidatus Nitrosotalea sp.]